MCSRILDFGFWILFLSVLVEFLPFVSFLACILERVRKARSGPVARRVYKITQLTPHKFHKATKQTNPTNPTSRQTTYYHTSFYYCSIQHSNAACHGIGFKIFYFLFVILYFVLCILYFWELLELIQLL
jgi:hypothetical protein